MKTLFSLALAAVIATPSLLMGAEPEKPKKLPAFQRKYDTNNDGKLDDAEKAAMKADRKTKREARKASDLQKFDENKDGKLDKAEKAKAKAARDAEKEAKKAERKKKREAAKAAKAAKA